VRAGDVRRAAPRAPSGEHADHAGDGAEDGVDGVAQREGEGVQLGADARGARARRAPRRIHGRAHGHTRLMTRVTSPCFGLPSGPGEV
jgi:hypothetical protein